MYFYVRVRVRVFFFCVESRHRAGRQPVQDHDAGARRRAERQVLCSAKVGGLGQGVVARARRALGRRPAVGRCVRSGKHGPLSCTCGIRMFSSSSSCFLSGVCTVCQEMLACVSCFWRLEIHPFPARALCLQLQNMFRLGFFSFRFPFFFARFTLIFARARRPQVHDQPAVVRRQGRQLACISGMHPHETIIATNQLRKLLKSSAISTNAI